MSYSYIDEFNIHEVFEENEFQKILIGTDKENPDNVVIINILNKANLRGSINISRFEKGLHNLVHLEETDNELVIVTDSQNGTPLNNYLEYYKTTLRHRINLAYEYLSKIVKYDIFNNLIKHLLVSESQILIKDGELYLTELIILNCEFNNFNEFNSITEKIGTTLERIIFSKESPNENKQGNYIDKILELIYKLKSKDHNYKNIKEIYEDFRQIYIYDMYMDESYTSNRSISEKTKEYSEIIPSEAPSIEAEDKIDYENNANVIDDEKEGRNIIKYESEEIIDEDKRRIRTKENEDKIIKKYIPRAVIGLFALAVIIYCLINVPLKTMFEIPDKPTASFEIEKQNDTWYFTNKSSVFGKDNSIRKIIWNIIKDDKIIGTYDTKNLNVKLDEEGEYKVILQIMDEYNQWSNEYSKIIYNRILDIDELMDYNLLREKLDKLDISYSDKGFIIKDYDIFRSGKYSLRFEKETDKESFIIKNLNLKDNPIISMWIASTSMKNIEIFLKGFNKGNAIFTQSISYTPKEIKSWEMLEISNISKNIDELHISMFNFDVPLWIDDIEIGSYK